MMTIEKTTMSRTTYPYIHRDETSGILSVPLCPEPAGTHGAALMAAPYKMVRCMLMLFMAGLFLPGSAHAQDKNEQRPNLDCAIGPLTKTYGATQWLLYACTDGKSLLAVTAAGNPAMPFYFTSYVRDGARKLVGEGMGKKSYTDAALKDLEKLSESDIAALIAAANQVKK